ncbi:adenosylcobinamide-GDP ribazoletransferase [Tumidithrix helvetica PCC 7403]|uniref:adenosylcobinamide-GDP ribazoletransferase n=1 Tax=Tumidithrix helvetica TaxID=3457545 RepID=UPI003CB68AFF
MFKQWQTFQAALIFYSCIPLHPSGNLDFRGIAVYAPVVGIMIGLLLGAIDWGLGWLVGTHSLLRAGLVTFAGVLLTGGLHLDGAMDTADGLAVTDRSRRLAVMVDSTTGAYGAIAAIAILLLKVLAIAELSDYRLWILISISAWGRWGQLRAIAAYPYLKPEGKGKFHRDSIQAWQVWLLGILLTLASLGIGGIFVFGFGVKPMLSILKITGICFSFAWLVGTWFNRQFGGHTGDTYGATVEWAETFSLCAIALTQFI